MIINFGITRHWQNWALVLFVLLLITFLGHSFSRFLGS